jgi:hypothetical protein
MSDRQPPVSVVISTLNRAESLRRTLLALRYQRYPTFEVVVVEGPSKDDATEQVVGELAGALRYVRCPDLNLSRSRNLGIEAASGEIVAFIDDDAIPEPRWLEQLVAAYAEPTVAGAGGIVYDYTGTRLQYVYSLSDRVGRTYYDRDGPFDNELLPGADPFIYLQGTNMSFRRERLVEIGGFDEEIEYNFDEVEVCLRMLDRGYELRPLAHASVLHQYLPSHVRNADRLMVDPYLAIKNRVYFALQNGRPERTFAEIMRALHLYTDEVREAAHVALLDGKFTVLQRDFYLDQVERGFDHGLTIGLTGSRQNATIPPPDPDAYRPFARLEPGTGRLTGCLLSNEYPPGDFGGVGRYTAELARGFAAEGHEVHVFTGSQGHTTTLDFEDGVWVHRVHVRDRRLPELRGAPVAGNLYLLAANYHEVCRLHERSPVDFVSAPLWLCEGLFSSLEERFPTITTLVTSMKTIAGLHPSWRDDPQPQAMLRLERETAARSDYVHAISQAILDQMREDYAEFRPTTSFVVPLGIEDRYAEPDLSPMSEAEPSDVTVLFVGRLERRKGVDVLLEAARRLLRELPHVSFVIAGKDTANTEQDLSYREAFQRSLADAPDLLGRVRFTGQVSEEELWRLYADCDVFCAPSRFESFGLVLVEAMMFAKPVVGCAVGGMREIVVEDVTGLLAEPGDVDSLTRCLRRLVCNTDLRRSLGEGARRRYLDRYELSSVTRSAIDAYRGVVERHRARADRQHEPIHPALAEVIATVAELDRGAADRVAERLLDPRGYPVDYRTEIEQAWGLPPRDFVRAVYSAILLRTPSELEAGLSANGAERPEWRMELVSKVGRSQEARNRRAPMDWLEELEARHGGSGGAAELGDALRSLEGSDSDFIDDVFRALVHRPPALEESASWLDYIAGGGARQEVITGVAASDEARARGVNARDVRARLGEVDPEPAVRRSWHLPDQQFVRGVYHAVLGREPDRGATGHLQHLASGGSRVEFVRAIATSEEAQRTGHDSQAWLRRLEASPPQLPHRRAVGGSAGLTVVRRVNELSRRARRYGRRARALPRMAEIHAAKLDEVNEHADELKLELKLELVRAGERQSSTARQIRELRSELRRLELETVGQLGGELRERIEALGAGLHELADSSELGKRIDAVGVRVHELAEAVRILRVKQEGVSLDVRERLATAREPPDPHPIDPQRLQRQIGESGVRLNLGCGEKPLPGYINVDYRALPGVDIVADVRRLPFAPGEVQEIASWHLVEHFRQHQLATVIVPYWRSLLCDGGTLKIVCPNWEEMLRRTHEGEMTLEEFKVVTFGLQDYEGDDHFAMYSPETLVALLRDAGFDQVDVIASDRRNGLSTEMELVAVKRETSDVPSAEVAATHRLID